MRRLAALVATLCLLATQLSASTLREGVTVSMFDGKSTAGWVVTGCEVAVEKGALVLVSGNGLVRSEHKYRDFVLEIEWKARAAKDWDSGIYFRAEEPPAGKPWPARYQANLLQGQEGNVNPLTGAKSTGLVKDGEWNRFQLTVIGTAAALKINDKQAWKAEGIEPATGYIALQAEVPKGGQFEFRNIRVTELDSEPLFNGSDLKGFRGLDGDPSACWKVEGDVLSTTGAKGASLQSEKEFGDFNLRLDYKVSEGGNSGVFLRTPRNGAYRGRQDNGGQPTGVEIQILDDRALKHANLKDFQYTGSVYGLVGPKQRVGRKPGEWNSLEINCVGDAIRIVHNGVTIVSASGAESKELGDRLRKGHIGLQNYGVPVSFRNVRIAPPMP